MNSLDLFENLSEQAQTLNGPEPSCVRQETTHLTRGKKNNADVQPGFVAGVDEVGRGPLVGDVVTAAVILNPNKPIHGLNDSKKLNEKKRETLFEEIVEKAIAFSIARATSAEIDTLNILHATMLAMRRAIEGLELMPVKALIDGNRVPEGLTIPAEAIVKGDGKVECISAASILAKVTRDKEMVELDRQYPEYGFAAHKGYPTKAHIHAIEKYGVIDAHRRSFKPVSKVLLASREAAKVGHSKAREECVSQHEFHSKPSLLYSKKEAE